MVGGADSGPRKEEDPALEMRLIDHLGSPCDDHQPFPSFCFIAHKVLRLHDTAKQSRSCLVGVASVAIVAGATVEAVSILLLYPSAQTVHNLNLVPVVPSA
jgi:hypothetical protein